MKTYKEVKRKVEDKVYCDLCGQSCTLDQFGSEYATLEAIWGYGSKKDGEKFDIQICENCFNETLNWMKEKRRINLGSFSYPHNKDPLNGENYNII